MEKNEEEAAVLLADPKTAGAIALIQRIIPRMNDAERKELDRLMNKKDVREAGSNALKKCLRFIFKVESRYFAESMSKTWHGVSTVIEMRYPKKIITPELQIKTPIGDFELEWTKENGLRLKFSTFLIADEIFGERLNFQDGIVPRIIRDMALEHHVEVKQADNGFILETLLGNINFVVENGSCIMLFSKKEMMKDFLERVYINLQN